MGVALSPSPREGLRFLEETGDFDEVAVGGGRFGTGMLRYLYADFPGAMFIPQFVVLFRRFGVGGSVEEFEVERFIGQAEIARWVDNGAVVDVVGMGEQKGE